MCNSNPSLVHKHSFQYTILETEVPDVPPQRVTLEVDGEVKLPELLEVFQRYLVAVGYVPPDNSVLDWVPKEN